MDPRLSKAAAEIGVAQTLTDAAFVELVDDSLKRYAKACVRTLDVAHLHALDLIAQAVGYADWQQLERTHTRLKSKAREGTSQVGGQELHACLPLLVSVRRYFRASARRVEGLNQAVRLIGKVFDLPTTKAREVVARAQHAKSWEELTTAQRLARPPAGPLYVMRAFRAGETLQLDHTDLGRAFSEEFAERILDADQTTDPERLRALAGEMLRPDFLEAQLAIGKAFDDAGSPECLSYFREGVTQFKDLVRRADSPSRRKKVGYHGAWVGHKLLHSLAEAQLSRVFDPDVGASIAIAKELIHLDDGDYLGMRYRIPVWHAANYAPASALESAASLDDSGRQALFTRALVGMACDNDKPWEEAFFVALFTMPGIRSLVVDRDVDDAAAGADARGVVPDYRAMLFDYKLLIKERPSLKGRLPDLLQMPEVMKAEDALARANERDERKKWQAKVLKQARQLTEKLAEERGWTPSGDGDWEKSGGS